MIYLIGYHFPIKNWVVKENRIYTFSGTHTFTRHASHMLQHSVCIRKQWHICFRGVFALSFETEPNNEETSWLPGNPHSSWLTSEARSLWSSPAKYQQHAAEPVSLESRDVHNSLDEQTPRQEVQISSQTNQIHRGASRSPSWQN